MKIICPILVDAEGHDITCSKLESCPNSMSKFPVQAQIQVLPVLSTLVSNSFAGVSMRFWITLIATAILGLVNLGWMTNNYYHDSAVLEARDRIQLILIDSAKDKRPLTEAENEEIRILSPTAKYPTPLK